MPSVFALYIHHWVSVIETKVENQKTSDLGHMASSYCNTLRRYSERFTLKLLTQAIDYSLLQT